MANSEDIEARLCAYIEGDLDPAQRLEIERHLAAHPPHQTMIQDLIATRNLLVALPLAEPPADMGEGLQGQLERSMLLGHDPNEHDPWAAHARRMPRIGALAAVLVVTFGLTAVIVQLLRLASHPAKIATIPAQWPVVISAAPATQPATQPVVDVAITPATQPAVDAAVPTTQPASPTAQLASFSAGPATQPSDESAGQPDGDDIEQAPADWPATDAADDAADAGNSPPVAAGASGQ